MTAIKIDIFELWTFIKLTNSLKITRSEVESNMPEIFDAGTSKQLMEGNILSGFYILCISISLNFFSF